MNYRKELSLRGYELQEDCIHDYWGRIIKKAAPKQKFKILVQAKILDIDISDLISQQQYEALEGYAEFALDEHEDQYNHMEYVLEWAAKVKPQYKEHMQATLDLIVKDAIEYHQTAPLIAKEAFGKRIGKKRTNIVAQINMLVKDGWLIEHAPKGRQANGLSHAKRYELCTPKNAAAAKEIPTPQSNITEKESEPSGFDW